MSGRERLSKRSSNPKALCLPRVITFSRLYHLVRLYSFVNGGVRTCQHCSSKIIREKRMWVECMMKHPLPSKKKKVHKCNAMKKKNQAAITITVWPLSFPWFQHTYTSTHSWAHWWLATGFSWGGQRGTDDKKLYSRAGHEWVFETEWFPAFSFPFFSFLPAENLEMLWHWLEEGAEL